MRFFISLLWAALFAPAALAQNATPTPPAPAAAAGKAASGADTPPGARPPAASAADRPPLPPRPEWRDTSGYRFPAVGKTTADMQNLAHAMRLRDYCADARVKDEFVRERLDRFGAMTGREETCRSLLDY